MKKLIKPTSPEIWTTLVYFKTIVIYISVEFRVLHFPYYLNGIPWASIPFKGVDVWGKGLHNQWNDKDTHT